MFARLLSVAVAIAAVLAVAAAGRADVTYTFDELAVNTAVTTQYKGVTFSVAPQSCSNSPTLYMRVKVPTGGTSSGTRALQIDTGCPDFSSDYLRMVFDLPLDHVSFTVGDYATTYIVRAYSTTSGTGLLSTQSIVVPGTGFVGVHRVVNVTSGSSNIRRIEIETSPGGLFETIDDLTFQPDPTPPTAMITSPTASACVCGSVTIRGTANDVDGTYLSDTCEYRAAGSSTWTLIGSASTPVSNGVLYAWNTSGLAEGLYFVRLTVANATGLSSTDVTSVWISANFDTVNFTVPTVIGGTVCPDGTVFDNWCGANNYAVEYSAVGSGVWQPVEVDVPTYPGSKVNEVLATWNTRSPLLADGNYLLRARGSNSCSDSLTYTSASLTLDNTTPLAVISSPVRCTALGSSSTVSVRGSAFDAHLASWSLYYTGGNASTWTLIGSGSSNVIDGTLGLWNTAGLVRCAYTLRLVVTDQAVVNCNAAIHNTTEYTLSVDLGCEVDFDRNGTLAVQDIFDYLNAWFAGCH